MKGYKYKGYTAKPYRVIGMEDVNWEVDVFGLSYYFRTISDFKEWVNYRLNIFKD